MDTTFTPSAQQITQTKQKIDAYIQSIDANPEHRSGAYPYHQFHAEGEAIRGTVLMFHGFSSKPHQMWRLTDYLFRNGFNVYQATLAGHAFRIPDKYWPQVDLKPEIANPLREKVQQDPVLLNFFANMMADPSNYGRLGELEKKALVARLVKLEPRLLNIVKAIELNEDPDFDRYFISSHMNYLQNARDRLAELEAMPGPIYTIGLSVGGSVALGLAADRPDRIKGVVAYAPLLKIYGVQERQYVMLAGPLDISESGWDPALQFPVGCLTAVDCFGSFVLSKAQTLQSVPTFLVLTENEDAADIETNQQFFKDIGGERKKHRLYVYPASDMVPHPMVDPTEISRQMSNRFWQSLYQETFRFLTAGEVDSANMANVEQNADLPQVPPV
ncbi:MULTISPECIES: alpha/beta hydrolase [Aerosakkonema]|uniref:alpha/beta hydrolase n=1 Tax=Aerosakkonema TaxID=1246629 RepID=UPI0035B926C0